MFREAGGLARKYEVREDTCRSEGRGLLKLFGQARRSAKLGNVDQRRCLVSSALRLLRVYSVYQRASCGRDRHHSINVLNGSRHVPMSLAEASEARKARLIALRKRKAGEAVDEAKYVMELSELFIMLNSRLSQRRC